MAEEIAVKPAPALGWPDVEGRETALLERCALGDEAACTELVEEHQRMVYQLGLHLLGDPQDALDLSQDVFLRVFHRIHQFRGDASLRTWIYRIVVTQARNRQRWWRRRRRDAQVSLDEHIKANGELPATCPRPRQTACCPRRSWRDASAGARGAARSTSARRSSFEKSTD